MAGEIFISYRRSDQGKARLLHSLLKERGVEAWYDALLAAGEDWRTATARALDAAPVFVLMFSQNASTSDDIAKELAAATLKKKIVVPVRLEEIDLEGAFLYELAARNWFDAFEDTEARLAQFADKLTALVRAGASADAARAVGLGAAAADALAPAAGGPGRRQVSICVLPFANMSGEVEQGYFSDGISEDIITDLSKVSALWVAARNTAFNFKGKNVDVPNIARQLQVSHVLEGSVRKSGNRVRITAQLIDASGGHVWAERYDRDLNDIFALQDEISQAIVAALKLKLLPEEKKAIERRGTNNLEAYNLYLMARQHNITGTIGNAHRSESIIRLCRRATEIDPNYALAWALMAASQGRLRHERGQGENGLAAAERALQIDPNLAEAHAAKSEYLKDNARYDEARAEIEIALRLDPESYEVNYAAARLAYASRRIGEAIRYFEKSAALMESDFGSTGLLQSCYMSIGDREKTLDASRRTLQRVEKVIATEPDNGSAMGFAVTAHATLGNAERAKEWAKRALLLDPDNKNMRYNFACSFVVLGEIDAALDLLEPVLAQSGIEHVNWTRKDTDLDPIRDHPRYKAMMAAAEARLGAAGA